jgi:hypothetical protein
MFSNFMSFRNFGTLRRRNNGRSPMMRGNMNAGIGNDYMLSPNITVNEIGPPGPTGPTGIAGDNGIIGPTGPTGIFIPASNTILPLIMVHATSYVAGSGGGIITVNSASPNTITLPVSVVGSVVTVVDSSGLAATNPITIQSSAVIGGESTYVISKDWGSVTLASDGTKWLIIGHS